MFHEFRVRESCTFYGLTLATAGSIFQALVEVIDGNDIIFHGLCFLCVALRLQATCFWYVGTIVMLVTGYSSTK